MLGKGLLQDYRRPKKHQLLEGGQNRHPGLNPTAGKNSPEMPFDLCFARRDHLVETNVWQINHAPWL
jgi:hypothetical protein